MSRPAPETIHPLLALLGIAFHGTTVLFAPFLVGGIGSAFLEVSEVAETGGWLTALGLAIIGPLFLVQVFGVTIKTLREAKYLRAAGHLTLRSLLDSAYRNARILTSRGYFVLVSGAIFVLLSLAFHWASLGVVAVASITLFYIVTGVAVFLSAFMVKTFEWGVGRDSAGIRREYHPPIGSVGESVEEHFILRKVPILPGFYLVVQDRLPPVLETEVRHVVPPRAGRKTVTLHSALRRTPRGTHFTGPARIHYVDMLGLTKVNVASLATGKVKILPTIQPVEIIDPPRTPLEEPDILTKPNKFPTEDFFRFREYQPGDDTRRLHWKLSMRVGRLNVRLPEAKEINAHKVIIALDTWVPPDWLRHTSVIDPVLDALVDVWVSTAHRLVTDGHKVQIMAAVPPIDGGPPVIERIDCNRQDRRTWFDTGARAAWQSQVDVFDLLGDDADYLIVLTSRLAAPPPDPTGSSRTTWIYLHPLDTLGPEPPTPYQLWVDWKDTGAITGFQEFLRWVQLPHPAGSDENALWGRIQHYRRRRQERDKKVFIRGWAVSAGESAFSALLARPDSVYRMQVLGSHYRLVGISNGGLAGHREVPPPPTAQEDGYPSDRGGAGSAYRDHLVEERLP
jgi:uncharacterized protein (DUF58 family)